MFSAQLFAFLKPLSLPCCWHNVSEVKMPLFMHLQVNFRLNNFYSILINYLNIFNLVECVGLAGPRDLGTRTSLTSIKEFRRYCAWNSAVLSSKIFAESRGITQNEITSI